MTDSRERTMTQKERRGMSEGTFREGEGIDGNEMARESQDSFGRGFPGMKAKEKDAGSCWTVTIAEQAEGCCSAAVG